VETVAGRVSRAVLILLALAAGSAAAETPALLAGYSFDENDLISGPDTFAVFQSARGQVRLSSDFRVSGYRSVRIRDVAGNGDFPELQGYFPPQTRGRLFAHFAFLTTDAHQELNIALAGPGHFTLKPNGIAFWLLVDKQGVLRHVSDSIPKRLALVRPFVWYTVDVDYDIDAGQYALRIWAEDSREPVAALADQPNAASHPGSAVDKFSFIGDLEDQSNVIYYVDDIVIGTSESVRQGPFVAPGRRKLFVNAYLDYAQHEAQRPRCFPVAGLPDIGLDPQNLGDATELGRALQTGRADVTAPAAVRAAAAYASACRALDAGRSNEAEAGFAAAVGQVPQAPLYRLAWALAALAEHRLGVASERLRTAYPDLCADTRYAVVAGMLATARGDLERAEATLRGAGERGASEAVDAYYHALMANRRYSEARAYALRFATPVDVSKATAALWRERAGDASFFLGDRDSALEEYSRVAELVPGNAAVLLKISDLAYLRGDEETERVLRERYFGALKSD
jgi:tetratricopeptide (TPR) repeat protein